MSSTYKGDNEIPIEEFENDFNGKSKDRREEWEKLFPGSFRTDEEMVEFEERAKAHYANLKNKKEDHKQWL